MTDEYYSACTITCTSEICETADAFRQDYARLAEIRSILKGDTPFIALTATATEAVRKIIIKDLAMKDCVEVITVPNKRNIRFSVSPVDPDNLYESLKWLIDDLETNQILNTQKVLIFCRKRGLVRELYETSPSIMKYSRTRQSFENCLFQ